MNLRLERIALTAGAIAGIAVTLLLLSLPRDDTTKAPPAVADDPLRPHALLGACSDNGMFLPRPVGLHEAVASVQPISPVLEVVVRPSFKAAKVLQLYPRDGQWWVGLVVVDFPVSHRHRREAGSPPVTPGVPPRLSIQFQERVVAEDTAARMVLEWRRSVATTQADPAMGLDGISYGFYFDGACAQMWSPKPASRNHRLAELVRALLDQAPDAELVRHLEAVGAPKRPAP